MKPRAGDAHGMSRHGVGRRRLSALAAAAGALALGGCGLDHVIERQFNTVYAPGDVPEIEAADAAAHERLFIADLHADTMLWSRDLLEEADYAHLDLPRLEAGNVALQVFSVVTETPGEMAPPPDARLIPEIRGNADAYCLSGDTLNRAALLQVAELRPPRTWVDREARAMFQAEQLKAFVAKAAARHAADPAEPGMMMIYDADDLAELVGRRRAGERVVGALLALEGAHWIGADEPDVEAGVDRLVAAGFRMLAPTHRFNNALGASSEGCDQLAGLTEAGRRFLDHAEARGVVLDLAHASDRGVRQAAAAAEGPVVVSHTGVRARCVGAGDLSDLRSVVDCSVPRNMADAEIHAVARTGGVIAVGYWPEAVGRGIENLVAAFAAVRDILSDPAFVAEMRAVRPDYDPVDHIAFGSDYDGAVAVPFDASKLVWLTTALRRAGFKETEIRRIAGANACRVFATRLPGGSAARAEAICAPLGAAAEPAAASAAAG